MTPAIVVLTDFFAVSNRALAFAAGLAVPLKAHLVLLHVRHDGLLSPEEYAKSERHDASEAERALKQLASSQPVPTEVEISDDFLTDAVAEAVRHHKPQMLVLGRPGTAATPVEIIAGAAMDLLRTVPYPLLIVPTVGWAGFTPRRLVMAVDGNDFVLYEHQNIVAQLLEALPDSTLTVLYVSNERDQRQEDQLRVTHAIRESGFDALTKDAEPRILYHSHPAQGIMQGATELDADMLVVVARRHSLLGSLFHRSVTAQLIGESALPILLLPAKD
ncbi:universal stress protein [Hymenobacter humi]|uniref:Universal stress protein n=1 Tax=Hymenobacter humi TaxID=1411620 RepID=A0ABW2UDR5_9BACT